METPELPSHLYHYTTFEGLKGILESKCLWATHCRFLNDSSEVTLFKNKLITHIWELLRLRNMPATLEQARELVERLYAPLDNEVYLISFCGNPLDEYTQINGLLSQWRGYGRDGGCVLVFNTQKLNDFLLKERVKFDYGCLELNSVVYTDDEKSWEKELAPLMSVISPFAISYYNWLENKTYHGSDMNEATVSALIEGITRYKHCGFKEENEVRIIAAPTPHDADLQHVAKESNLKPNPEVVRKFRTKNGYQTPYIDLFNSDDFLSSIVRIIIGPHRDKEKRRDYLKVWLRHKSIDIHASDTPYIG